MRTIQPRPEDPQAFQQMTLSELVVEMARAVVEKPALVRAEIVRKDEAIVIQLIVDPDDIGLVIGRQGQTARSFRTIVGAASMKLKQRISLEIMNRLEHPEGERSPQ